MLTRARGVVACFVAVAALGEAPLAAEAQQAAIQGMVTSAVTGGPLEGVEIRLESAGQQQYGTLTDRNGFYQIGGIEPGSYTLRGRLIGHVQHEQVVALAPGERETANFRMHPIAVELEDVVVVAPPAAISRDLGRQRITPADLRLVPVPAGSGDLASYLQTLPGVTTTGDRGGQLFVRGGSSAENLALVDGIPIYQPFHILGFFSVFPEDLVSSVDFYAGGFGARYSGRTSSVLDVALRDGDSNRHRAMGSVSPFLAEALVEGPVAPGVSWMGSFRRSLVEETSGALLGTRQPLTFDSQLLKLTITDRNDVRCSALTLRTSDRGRLDPQERESRVSWNNFLLGGRCVSQLQRAVRLLEVSLSYSSVENRAISRGASRFRSGIDRVHHDVHATGLFGSIPFHAGLEVSAELTDHDLEELFGVQRNAGMIFGAGAYVEAAVQLGARLQARPGVVGRIAPRAGLEPRLRASWEPFGRSSETVQGSLGLYQQDLIGTSDMRDVGSVFVAWMRPPDDLPVTVLHGQLGWQQALGAGIRWSIEGFYRQLRDVPVPAMSAVAQFNTRLVRADGRAYGADLRLDFSGARAYGFVGYGYGWTEYESAQAELASWFGDPVLRYHPPHDRRHQVNALASADIAGFQASARWQLGSGLPFTRPLGFDEAFDAAHRLHDVTRETGTSRMVLDRPFDARLPLVHRLDLSLERGFDLARGRLTVQAGAINSYDRRNMFYYDLFSGRRVDQLPLAPYAAVTMRGR